MNGSWAVGERSQVLGRKAGKNLCLTSAAGSRAERKASWADHPARKRPVQSPGFLSPGFRERLYSGVSIRALYVADRDAARIARLRAKV